MPSMQKDPRNYRIMIAALIAVIVGLIIGLIVTSGGDDGESKTDAGDIELPSAESPETVSAPETTSSTPDTDDGGTSAPSQDSQSGGTAPPSSGRGTRAGPTPHA